MANLSLIRRGRRPRRPGRAYILFAICGKLRGRPAISGLRARLVVRLASETRLRAQSPSGRRWGIMPFTLGSAWGATLQSSARTASLKGSQIIGRGFTWIFYGIRRKVPERSKPFPTVHFIMGNQYLILHPTRRGAHCASADLCH